jgi:hypothetical protein
MVYVHAVKLRSKLNLHFWDQYHSENKDLIYKV